MVKKLTGLCFIVLLAFGDLFAGDDIFEKNCVACHKGQAVSLENLFYRYLLKYSSEKRVKEALMDYMKNPDYFKSVMPQGYINRYGIKIPSKLKDEDLKKAIDMYWEKYKLFGKLK